MSKHNGIEHEQTTGAGAYEFSAGSAVEINRACDAFWARRGTVDPATRWRPFGAHAPVRVQPAFVAPAADPAPAGAPSEPSSSETIADTPAVAVPPEPLTPEPVLEEAVCEELNVAPCVAAQVVAHAWRRGLDLFAPAGGDVDEPMLRHAANLMHAAWISWIDRRHAA